MIDETEALAEAFSRLLKPVRLEGCPCCTDDTVGKRLREGSGWSASTRDLDHYAPKAMTTWGSVNDFKHFLPAIFERSLGGQLGTPFEIVLGKLGYGEFENWPEHEKAAVRTWLSISFGNCPYSIRSHAPQTQYWHSTLEWADAVLAGGASLFEDVTPLLTDADEKNPAFRTFYASEYYDPRKRRLSNGFWERDSENYRRVLNWAVPPVPDVSVTAPA